MYDLPQNTVFTYAANPLFNTLDFSHLPVSELAKEIQAFKRKKNGHVAPERDALAFYFLNHAFHLMKSKHGQMETLNKDMVEVAEQHIQLTNEIAKRLFFYSVIIAVEEARFIPQQNDTFFEFMRNRYGQQFHDYVKGGFRGALTDFGKLDMTCGEYATAMVSVFAFGKWQPGFGGKGWVPIAALVSDCVHGSLSFEQFADQAFSLCHNNGSMFNKGHFYNCYTNFIYTILDIQDSGQIPQWIANNPTSPFVDKKLKHVFDIMAKSFPEEMTGKVDKTLISNSEKKRAQKAAMLAKQQQAAWNNWHQTSQQPAQKVNTTESKINNILLGGMGGMK